MAFTVSGVDASDAEGVVGDGEVAAMQNSPVFRTMFPQFDTITHAQREDITRWYVEIFKEAFQDEVESFFKASTIDGSPVGFCGWIMMQQNPGRQAKATYGQAKDGQANKRPKEEGRHKERWIPEAIDMESWSTVSDAISRERDRVLTHLDNICHVTFMAVNPSYQRQGIGSMMLRRICEEADQRGHYVYVDTAPEGVSLYAKFRFNIVGRVQTRHGTIRSMLRTPHD